MDEEPRKPDKSHPQWQPARRAVSWDCMDCITINDEESIEIRDRGETADKYWADGWTVGLCDIRRSDFDSDSNGRYHRVYPTRYFVSQVEMTRSKRRVLARNTDLRVITRPLRITSGKEKLYIAHHLNRFGYQPDVMLNQRYKYIVYHPAKFMETCYFLDDELIAFSILEVGDYSIWSNTGVWSPAHADRSLGTLTVLGELEYARKNGLLIYYMGHYFPGNPYYEYKTRYQPLELYDWDHKGWVGWHSARAAEMIREPLRRHSDDE